MNKIKPIRQLLGLSQQALADALGCRQSMITHYEMGRFNPSLKMAKKLQVYAVGKGITLTLDQIYDMPTPKRAKAAAATEGDAAC